MTRPPLPAKPVTASGGGVRRAERGRASTLMSTGPDGTRTGAPGPAQSRYRGLVVPPTPGQRLAQRAR